MSKRWLSVMQVFLVVVSLFVLAHPASAQDSGISGVVSDGTGGVLPGVTVTASSPALIEGQRVAISDGEGRYTFAQLIPGTYSVTFGLPGFSTVLREDLALTSGFTANIDAAMTVGGVEETITVTGATPVVDIQNVRKQTLATAEVLSTLPMSTKHVNNLVTLTPGFTGLADVGGKYTSQVGGSYHGKRGTKVSMDGMGVENSFGNSSYQVNAAAVSEMVMQTTGISADTNADGAVVNVIPKEGGNIFSGQVSGFFTNKSMEANNLTQSLKDKGLGEPNQTIKMFDESLALGGPIAQNKAWYFVAARSWGFSRKIAGLYWNQSTWPGAPDTGLPKFLTPDSAPLKVVNLVKYVDMPDNRYSGRLEWYDSYITRLTLQPAEKHKFNFTYDDQRACNCGSSSAGTMQEAASGYRFDPNHLWQATWTSTQTSRLLLEAGFTAALSQWNSFQMPGVEASHVRIQDQGLGIAYGSYGYLRGDPNETFRYSERASLSYVTGSHNFKAGFQYEQMVDNVYTVKNGNVEYRFNNAVPNRISMFTTPYLQQQRAQDLGIYVQDQWIMDRLTLNLGVRFDKLYGYIPAQDLPGQPSNPEDWPGMAKTNYFLADRSFDRVEGTPDWKDINPRIGAAYDVFGDGRTAVKASIGRYVAKIGTEISAANNPIVRSVNATTRSWNDADGDYVPDCALENYAANGECGGISNTLFGSSNPNAVKWDPNVLTGLRDSNWDISAELQQQISDGLSITAGYYWNNAGYYKNTNSKNRVTANTAVGAADYDEYCVTAPTDSRLPGGGGNQICGLYNIKPEKYGQVNSFYTTTSTYGDDVRRNHFLNATVDARLPNGMNFGGGADTGLTTVDRCFTVDSPQELLHCKVETPFSAQTQLKVYGSVPLPGDTVASFTYQNLSGATYGANMAYSNAVVQESLGRPLSGGASRVTVPLVAPQTLFADRVSRIDFRASKIITVDRFRIQLNFDAYNLMNVSSVMTTNSYYGGSWQRPNSIIDPRILQFGGQIDF